MGTDGYGYGSEDLTPGTFMAGKNLTVNTDSLMTSGRSLMKLTSSFFGGSMAMPISLVKSDYGRAAGDRAIGNDPAFDETTRLANFLSGEYGAAQAAEKLSQDLFFGCHALANVAMVMSEEYGATDGFNACQNADAVDDAFNPPAGTKNTLAAQWGETDDERLERNRQAHLPRVHPADVKYYIISGLKEGEDYMVEDTTPPGTLDPGHDGDFSNGEDTTPTDEDGKPEGDGESNPYYHYDGENDYDLDRPAYIPPNPEVEDDTQTVAPGHPGLGAAGGNSPSVV